jgi:hypothetical protein
MTTAAQRWSKNLINVCTVTRQMYISSQQRGENRRGDRCGGLAPQQWIGPQGLTSDTGTASREANSERLYCATSSTVLVQEL